MSTLHHVSPSEFALYHHSGYSYLALRGFSYNMNGSKFELAAKEGSLLSTEVATHSLSQSMFAVSFGPLPLLSVIILSIVLPCSFFSLVLLLSDQNREHSYLTIIYLRSATGA
jgi:hypothetical protein